MLDRIAGVNDWGPRAPSAMQVRPRFRWRQWTLGLEVFQAVPGGERVVLEAGFRLPPRRRGRAGRSGAGG